MNVDKEASELRGDVLTERHAALVETAGSIGRADVVDSGQQPFLLNTRPVLAASGAMIYNCALRPCLRR